jgi:cytochrome c553
MMRTIAAKLTDQEMKAVAEYISGLHWLALASEPDDVLTVC